MVVMASSSAPVLTVFAGAVFLGTVPTGPPGEVPAPRPAQSQVEPVGIDRVEQAELLDHGQRCPVSHLDPPRPDPDRLRGPGQQSDDDRWRCAGHAGIEVMLGHPIPLVPE
jgi:hypothetical protein